MRNELLFSQEDYVLASIFTQVGSLCQFFTPIVKLESIAVRLEGQMDATYAVDVEVAPDWRKESLRLTFMFMKGSKIASVIIRETSRTHLLGFFWSKIEPDSRMGNFSPYDESLIGDIFEETINDAISGRGIFIELSER